MSQSLLFVAFLALGYGCLGPVDKLAYQLLRIPPGQFAIWSSHAGDMLAYLTALATVLYLRRQPKRLMGFLLLLAGQHVLTHGSKWFFQTSRPPQIGRVEGYAYPSGHTMTAACIYGYLAYRTRGPARTILLALPLLVAWSRVALGHHWLSDVIGSLLLARLWLSLCPRLMRASQVARAAKPRAKAKSPSPYAPVGAEEHDSASTRADVHRAESAHPDSTRHPARPSATPGRRDS
ncbi:MAG: phosphatase PAP2 family protein [Candidatus Eremiobacteraeota bacterium]|nr:phosphatase PAP2 family protein [Candidatus Eremiobacteraeota bacterium]